MMLYARRDAMKDTELQVIDGASLSEILQPVIQMRDGASAIGYPWEFKYSKFASGNSPGSSSSTTTTSASAKQVGGQTGGLWYKSKQGGDPGYRSSLTLVPELNLGVFVSALTDPVDEDSVWSVPGE
jgi:hypothetical protein